MQAGYGDWFESVADFGWKIFDLIVFGRKTNYE